MARIVQRNKGSYGSSSSKGGGTNNGSKLNKYNRSGPGQGSSFNNKVYNYLWIYVLCTISLLWLLYGGNFNGKKSNAKPIASKLFLPDDSDYDFDDDYDDDVDSYDDAYDDAHTNAFILPSKRTPEIGPRTGDNDYGFDIGDVNSFTRTASAFKDDLTYTQQVAVAEQTTPRNDDINPPKFLFVHVGKSGGTTIFKNIRILCLIKNIEQNISKLRTNYTNIILPCMRQLNHQAINFNPSNEMKISTNDMVIGSLHMNQKSWWWNADDDEESKNRRNGADQIRWILSFGKENAWNETALRNPKYYEGKDNGLADSTAFLIPVRDPIDRIVSAFNYHHPENMVSRTDCNELRKNSEHNRKMKSRRTKYWVEHSFFCMCFPTANDLADVFLVAKGGNNTISDRRDQGGNKTMRFVPSFHSWVKERISCLELAEMTLRGNSSYKEGKPSDGGSTKEQLEEDYLIDRTLLDFDTGAHKDLPMIGHISINYGFYYRRTLAKHPSKKVVALRTEHMFEDLQNLERQLGGTARIEGDRTGHRTESYGSGGFKVSTKVSDPKRLQALCCAIASEAAIYIELIQRSSNLSGAQKKESLEAFSERCDLSMCAVTAR